MILIGGGVRSGKSAFALSLARRQAGRRVYLATAEPGDAEMRERIARHAAERGDDFATVEEPLALVEAVGRIDAEVLVLDCLTFWLANLLMRERAEGDILAEAARLEETIRSRPFRAIVVTNEVGMGIVPESALGRAFRDVAGRAHRRFARAADEVYFGALGMMLRLKPGPVAAVEGS